MPDFDTDEYEAETGYVVAPGANGIVVGHEADPGEDYVLHLVRFVGQEEEYGLLYTDLELVS